MLTVVAVVFAACLSVAASLLNFFAFAVLIQAVYFVLIAIYLLVPEQSAAILDSLFNWLKVNLRAVAITIFTVFGLFFLIKGFMDLAA